VIDHKKGGKFASAACLEHRIEQWIRSRIIPVLNQNVKASFVRPIGRTAL
jgi:hypothetical protein